MRDSEIREFGALAGLGLREVTRGVGRIHGSIAGRVHGAVRRSVGEAALPVEVATGLITRLSYAAVHLGLSGASRVGGLAAARAWADERPAGDSAGRLLGFVNGSHGHHLTARDSPLALPMTVRRGGEDVALTVPAFATAWPDATREIAVFVHGLVLTERDWEVADVDDAGEPRPDDRQRPVSHPRLLAEQLGLTPVTVRYNTGRRIADNGRDLSVLLRELVAAWPTPVTRVVLIGHSMGGLVCRSALAEPAAVDDGWRSLVTDLVTLGSPHEGSWLEQAVVRFGPHLRRLPETAWFGEQLDHRSEGIRDLVGMPIGPPRRPVRERAIVATVTRGLGGRVGRAFGDTLVGVDSARGGLPDDDVAVIHGLSHLALLHDPRVGHQLVAWLAPLRSESLLRSERPVPE